jgi:hypothetical protein
MGSALTRRFRLTEEEIELLGFSKKKNNKYYLNAHNAEKLSEIRGYDVMGKRIGELINKNIPQSGKTEVTESGDNKSYEYKGSMSIQDLDTALEYFKVDLDKWTVEDYKINSWDSGSAHTNYQVKVRLKRKESLIIQAPLLDPLKFNYKGESQMWIIIGCIHRPFHNKELWNGLLHLLQDHKKDIHGIIINGDYLDLRSLSTHDDFIPEGLDLGIEYTDGLKGMIEIKQALGKEFNRIEKVFHFGNHEDRFYRHAEDLRKYGDTLKTPEEALRLREDNWKVQVDWKEGYTTIGQNTDIFHGVYYGANPAKQHLDREPTRNMIFNHSHRFMSYSNGKATSYNVGWLGDVNSEGFKYAHRFTRGNWQNGFCVAYIDKDGEAFITPVRCKNNAFFFGGKMY